MRLHHLLIIGALLAAGCDSSSPVDSGQQPEQLPATGGPERPDGELNFARYAPGIEPEVTSASFWAVPGQTRSLVIRYRGQDPGDPPLMEFIVGPQSLLTLPGLLPLLPADSVQIFLTIAVDTEQRRFTYYFEPSGLLFSPLDPARLRLNYDVVDPDLNGDGTVDGAEIALRQRLRVWQQEMTGLPWLQIPTLRLPGLDMLEGRVMHFTGFAMAS